MDTAIWMAQLLLAVIFMMAGLFKIAPPKVELGIIKPWARYFSHRLIKVIGIFEIICAIGLIIPMAIKMLPWLTAAAALALAFEMIIALRTHLAHNKKAEIALDSLLALTSVVIAVYRIV